MCEIDCPSRTLPQTLTLPRTLPLPLHRTLTQILMMCKIDLEKPGLEMSQSQALTFVSQLKGGRGLSILGSVVPGRIATAAETRKRVEQSLRQQRDANKIRGFTQVIMAVNVDSGLTSLIQTAGLGGLAPNTVMVNWTTHANAEEERAARLAKLFNEVCSRAQSHNPVEPCANCFMRPLFQTATSQTVTYCPRFPLEQGARVQPRPHHPQRRRERPSTDRGVPARGACLPRASRARQRFGSRGPARLPTPPRCPPYDYGRRPSRDSARPPPRGSG